MHPTLAKYLNWRTARETLERDELGQPLRQDERAFAAVARTLPEERALLLGPKGINPQEPSAQRALLLVAAQAAAAELREDPKLGGRMLLACSTLTREGASPEEVDGYMTSLVIEEAFSADESVDTFDAEFFEGSLSEIPVLAGLTRDRLETLYAEFAGAAPLEWQRAYTLAAQELTQVAWEEGPKPIHVEDLEEALRRAEAKMGASERSRAVESMRRWVRFLADAAIISPPRLTRLDRALGKGDRLVF